MPFETPIGVTPKTAVVGGGISGLGAAWGLAGSHNVTLFEAGPRIGGHARTVMAGRDGDLPVDTGFLVYNHSNYPHLTSLFAELNVPTIASDMSFAASIDGGRLEYGVSKLSAVFAQKRNLFSPRYLGFIRDLLRWLKEADDAADDPEMTIADLMVKMNLGDWFRDYYLLPISGAIWSTPPQGIMDFPAQTLVQFFKNHALLGNGRRHQWRTVKGGSREYLWRMQDRLTAQGVDIRCNAPVLRVARDARGVSIWSGGEMQRFDQVIFATHSDQALRLLADPTNQENAQLGAIKFQPNQMVLHADSTVMPKRRAAWCSWNYTETAEKNSDRIDLTYWINRLQSLPEDDPVFVTLNTNRDIDPALIYDQTSFHHPVFDHAAIAAQKEISANNGANRTWFAGAWMGHGFHEDGLKSGLDVAKALALTQLYPIAAE